MKMKRIFISMLGMLALSTSLFAKADTYIYDYWGDIERSPDAYRVVDVYYADELGVDNNLRIPSNLFCVDNLVYVCDKGNNRILELEYTEEKTLELKRVIDSFNTNGADVDNTFSEPSDIFINADGSMYIADKKNGRVVKLDSELNYLYELTQPVDPTYDQNMTFLPEKVVADKKGRAYVLAMNVNKGFIKYEADGTFTGFYGATPVMYDALDMLWKKFATRAQRAQMVMSVPTEYSNCYMDHEGFIYSVTKNFDEWDLLSDKAKPIRRLNALGNDILVKNGHYIPVGDLEWGNAGGVKGPAKFTDITVLENDVYIAVDETHGRLFAYNNQGFLLFAFGGRGNIDGYFRQPTSVDHIGKDLFVLDELNGSITVFTPTKFGDLVFGATEDFACGKYDDSAEKWEQVLQINGNYDLAYIGLGKAYVNQKRYKEAMDYFKLKRSKRYYSKAFTYYRKEWIEANIGWVVAVILVLVLVPLIIKRVRLFIMELKSL